MEKQYIKFKPIKLNVKNVEILLNQSIFMILKCVSVIQLVLMEDMNI